MRNNRSQPLPAQGGGTPGVSPELISRLLRALDCERRASEEYRRIIEEMIVAPGDQPARTDFVPSDVQRQMLAMMHGEAARTTLFKAKFGSKMWRHLEELKELGLVVYHHRVGYYRPDAPPPYLDAILNAPPQKSQDS